MWAFITLAFSLMTSPSALGCEGSAGTGYKWRHGPECFKTHKFSQEYKGMALITKLDVDRNVFCGKWTKGFCATGRYRYDPNLLDKQTGTLFKGCAFYNLPKNVINGSCDPWRLGKNRTLFFLCVCKRDYCNRGDRDPTTEILRKELEYSKRVQYPGEYPKPRTKDPSGGDEDIPDISTAEEDYTYAEL